MSLFSYGNNFKYSDYDNEIVDKLYIADGLSKAVDIEQDHQRGRFALMEKVFNLISQGNVKGDIVEFGSWKGQGLIYLTYLRNKLLNENLKVIGIDAFEGLPLSEDGWVKGMFNNTSLEEVKSQIANKKEIIGNTDNVEIVKGYFNSQHVKEYMSKIDNIAFIYFDGDLKTSTLEALNIVEKFFINQKTIYIAFDDWGCSNYTLCAAFGKFFHHLPNFSFKNIGSTALTVFFEITNHNLTE